ncbi:MAG: hypothetical protein M1821_006545 [Bathelium mastoideum]|nr:MAG: hypothetical protein M1821_006545 [Bathelium mastoideum]KAI9693820.1 MAG: hypothetical protein M1822_003091 [Bathelium mastoideum]
MRDRRGTNASLSSSSSSTANGLLSPRKGLTEQLLPSPPPSPGLPALLPRHGKKSSSKWVKVALRLLAGFVAATLIIIMWSGFWILYPQAQSIYYSAPTETDPTYELVGDQRLPSDPSPVLVTDKSNKNRWTVSIPQNHAFPLRPAQYQQICELSTKITSYFVDMSRVSDPLRRLARRDQSYYSIDNNFLDVHDAEQQGLLPKPEGTGSDTHATFHGHTGDNVCERSLTYVMETPEAGFGNTLMRMWMAYGLAQEEGRAFFIDDSRWPYGKFNTFFEPPPAANCTPPPKHHILPCPHHARHLLVSEATSDWTFGKSFDDTFTDAKKTGPARHERAFKLARAGYEKLFSLAGDDAVYVNSRLASLNSTVRSKTGLLVGLHVRRGDKHPLERQYSRDYLPLDRYYDEARGIVLSQFAGSIDPNTGVDTENWAAEIASQVLVASDDPDVYRAPELSRVGRAQDRIQLASKTVLDEQQHQSGASQPSSAGPASAYHAYMPENSGWEGGFFAPLFWSLGRAPARSDRPVREPEQLQQRARALEFERRDAPLSASPISGEPGVPEAAMQLRELLGRAYMLDLAVLGGGDGVVCGASATGCRLLAVMMGWEKAMAWGMWVNVDKGVDGWRALMS